MSADKICASPSIMERFQEINRTFPKSPDILSAKASGQKVIGWVCTYVPEELLHAAGALPVRISGYAGETDLQDGTAYFYVNNCSFARSCLQLALRGNTGTWTAWSPAPPATVPAACSISGDTTCRCPFTIS